MLESGYFLCYKTDIFYVRKRIFYMLEDGYFLCFGNVLYYDEDSKCWTVGSDRGGCY